VVSATGLYTNTFYATRVGRATFNNLEALIIAAAFYWLMTLILTFLQSKLEARLSRGDR
jgi:polar amino acid transport system permease protein